MSYEKVQDALVEVTSAFVAGEDLSKFSRTELILAYMAMGGPDHHPDASDFVKAIHEVYPKANTDNI